MTESVKKPKAAKKTAAKKAEAPAPEKAAASKPAAKKAETPAPVAAPAHVSHEQVAELAHRLWAERGHHHGSHVDDWFRAEQQLRGKAS